MARAERRRVVRRLRRAALAVLAEPDEMTLSIGPGPRGCYGPGWPDREVTLLATWNRRRDAILAQTAPARPWALFWFDRPHTDTIPGPIRDAHLAAGRLSAVEARMMATTHTWHAFGAIAASRPGQVIADWLADPALIDATIALVGWNPFTPEVIAHLRAKDREVVPPNR